MATITIVDGKSTQVVSDDLSRGDFAVVVANNGLLSNYVDQVFIKSVTQDMDAVVIHLGSGMVYHSRSDVYRKLRFQKLVNGTEILVKI